MRSTLPIARNTHPLIWKIAEIKQYTACCKLWGNSQYTICILISHLTFEFPACTSPTLDEGFDAQPWIHWVVTSTCSSSSSRCRISKINEGSVENTFRSDFAGSWKWEFIWVWQTSFSKAIAGLRIFQIPDLHTTQIHTLLFLCC